MNSHIARKVVQFFNQIPQFDTQLELLSEREKEVLDLLSRGQLYKQIADNLGITLDTVRKHLQSIYQKLHVHSRTEAVVKYLQKYSAYRNRLVSNNLLLHMRRKIVGQQTLFGTFLSALSPSDDFVRRPSRSACHYTKM